MTWIEYQSLLSPEEQATICTENRRASLGYRKHYHRWKRQNDPVYQEKAHIHARRYRQRNKAKNSLRAKIWRKAHPDKIKIYKQNERKRQKEKNERIAKTHHDEPILSNITWEEYKLSLPTEEQALICSSNAKRSLGYSRHYQRWKRLTDPEFKQRAKESQRKCVARQKRGEPAKPRNEQGSYRRSAKFRLRKAARTRLTRHLAKNGIAKDVSTMTIIGLTPAKFREYLQSLWKPGMTWENYGMGPGKWQMDHIIPLASAGEDREAILKLCHYTNLQPLWYEENIRKSDNLVWPRIDKGKTSSIPDKESLDIPTESS